ncbi:hypothetical protein [Methylotenera sp.]|uniref:hypothetical protein n=1 Tax=Methylotenera sp. TaxID=2051956 RepID=UPI002488741D|nr:hypothetical protein [Methylotenera sp.]MDI1298278.1 hypothetical protein [Methylotenera sp.]
MKPVRRRIRRHFGLTAKQVAVRSQRPWYFQWVVATLFVLIGYVAAYWQFTGGENLTVKLNQAILENQGFQTKIIQVEQQIKIEQASQKNLNEELKLVHDENIKLKEDLLFYKNMLGKK